MKITDSKQLPAAQQVEQQEKARPTAGKQAAGKPQQRDKVEFSNPPDAELQALEAQQAQRVQAIKSQVQAGKYRVSSRDVAEKMLVRGSRDRES